MKDALRWLDAAVRSFAAACGWKPDDYRVYVHVNETWGGVHLLVAARVFPGDDPQAQWLTVLDHLQSALRKGHSPFASLHLTLRTFDQIAEGGLYAVGDQFTPLEELVAPAPAA